MLFICDICLLLFPCARTLFYGCLPLLFFHRKLYSLARTPIQFLFLSPKERKRGRGLFLSLSLFLLYPPSYVLVSLFYHSYPPPPRFPLSSCLPTYQDFFAVFSVSAVLCSFEFVSFITHKSCCVEI